MKPRLAVFDLDGTLVGPGGAVAPSAAEAIGHLPGRGVRVAPLTTRAFPFARTEFRQFGLSVPAIAAAGADVRADDGKVIRQVALEPADADFLVQLFDEHGQRGLIATPDRVYTTTGHEGQFPPPSLRIVERMQDACIEDLLSVVMEMYEADPAYTRLLRWEGAIRFELIGSTEARQLAVVTHVEASRLAGLRALCEDEGVSLAETVIFADGPEDIPMMEAAGLSVAVADAPEEVKRHAGMITRPREEDGIAEAIARIWG